MKRQIDADVEILRIGLGSDVGQMREHESDVGMGLSQSALLGAWSCPTSTDSETEWGPFRRSRCPLVVPVLQGGVQTAHKMSTQTASRSASGYPWLMCLSTRCGATSWCFGALDSGVTYRSREGSLSRIQQYTVDQTIDVPALHFESRVELIDTSVLQFCVIRFIQPCTVEENYFERIGPREG